MPLVLRNPTKADLEAILQLNYHVMSKPWTRRSIETELESAAAVSVVAEDGGLIEGFLFARKLDCGAEITLICVSQKRQRRGIGAKLIGELSMKLQYQGEIQLEVSSRNLDALAFYQRLGFSHVRTRSNYYSDQSDGICMKLELAKRQSF